MGELKSLDNKAIGERLVKMRKSLDSKNPSIYKNISEMGQDEFIQELGLLCTQSTISRWEKGKGSISIDAAYKYSQYFHKSIDYILTSKEFKISHEDTSMVKKPSNLSDLFRIFIDFMRKTPFTNFSLNTNKETLQSSLENLYGKDNARLIKKNMDKFIKDNGIESKEDFYVASFSTNYSEQDMQNENEQLMHPEPKIAFDGIEYDNKKPLKSLIFAFIIRYNGTVELMKKSREEDLGIDVIAPWLKENYDLASGYSIYGEALSANTKPYKLIEIVRDNIAEFIYQYYEDSKLDDDEKISFIETVRNIIHRLD